MSDELKPCPFCGSTDLSKAHRNWNIKCNNCAAEGPWNSEFDADKAASDWNSRAQPSDGALANYGAESVAYGSASCVIFNSSPGGCLEPLYRRASILKECNTSAAASASCTYPSGDGSLRWPCPVHPPEPAAGVWNEGSPPHPWDSEWFLAKMVQGPFVVLRPLPEEYTYDFTTADGTYVMRKSIARWAQLSGSEYIAPASTESRS